MTQDQQEAGRERRRPGTPGPLSRWIQHKANARVNRKIRRGRGTMMGMDLLILHTVGCRSGQPRETPVAWFADGEDRWLIVASGGASQHPDWYANLMANPDQAAIELPGRGPLPVTPHRLGGTERDEAWRRVTAVQPRYARYQRKSERAYPVIRLARR